MRHCAPRRPPVRSRPIDVSGATVVLRHADVEALARDHRLAGVGLVMFDLMGITGRLRDWYGSLMFTNEGEPHDRMRTLVTRAFSPRKVEALRPGAAELVTEAFDAVAPRRRPRRTRSRTSRRPVMCRLLGVPERDMERFSAWGDALSPIFGFMDPQQISVAAVALDQLLAYIGDLTDQRRNDPADDHHHRAACRRIRRRPAHPRRDRDDGREPARRRTRHDDEPGRLLAADAAHASPRKRSVSPPTMHSSSARQRRRSVTSRASQRCRERCSSRSRSRERRCSPAPSCCSVPPRRTGSRGHGRTPTRSTSRGSPTSRRRA